MTHKKWKESWKKDFRIGWNWVKKRERNGQSIGIISINKGWTRAKKKHGSTWKEGALSYVDHRRGIKAATIKAKQVGELIK